MAYNAMSDLVLAAAALGRESVLEEQLNSMLQELASKPAATPEQVRELELYFVQTRSRLPDADQSGSRVGTHGQGALAGQTGSSLSTNFGGWASLTRHPGAITR